MSQRNHIDSYQPPTSVQGLTIEEIRRQVGIVDGDNIFTSINALRIMQRSCVVLEMAAAAALATLPFLYEYFPANERPWVQPTIHELQKVINYGKENYLATIGPKPEQKKLEDYHTKLQEAVAHAGNLINNSAPLRVPREVLRPFLEVRDICDSAVREPHF